MRRLLIRPGAIGDCIVSLPALEHLRTGYTEVWVSGQNAPLIQFADRVRSIASTGLDLLGIVDSPVLETLRSFDEIWSWYGTNRPEFREAVADLPFRFFPALPSDGVHAVDFYAAQAGAPQGLAPVIQCPPSERSFIAVHPFSGSPKKNWPFEHFRKLVHSVRAEWANDRYADLYQLACWLSKARAYVGNDSGISHLAAAVGTPVVAIFTATDPAVWAPRGPHTVVMQGIPSVEEVQAALHELIA